MDKIQIYREKLVTDYLRLLNEVEGELLENPQKLPPELIRTIGNLLYIDSTPICSACPHSCIGLGSIRSDCYLSGLAATDIRHFLHLYWLTNYQKSARRQIIKQVPRIILSLLEVKGQVAAQFGVNEVKDEIIQNC